MSTHRKFAALTYSNVSPSQLSSVPTQLNSKAALTGATFTGDVAIQGNLTLTGVTTAVDTAQLVVKDPVITLNTAALNQPTGVFLQHPSGSNVAVLFKNDALEFVKTSTPGNAVTYTADSYASVRANAVHASAVQTQVISRALVSNGAGHVIASDVSSNALQRMANVTSDIQTQLNALATKSYKQRVFLGQDWTHANGLTVLDTPLQFAPLPFSTYIVAAQTFLTSNAATDQLFRYAWKLPANTAQFAWSASGGSTMLVESSGNVRSIGAIPQTCSFSGVIRTANCAGNLVLTGNAVTLAGAAYTYTLLAPSYLTYHKVMANFAPSAIVGINSAYTLAYNTPLSLALTSLDSESPALAWSYAVTSGVLGNTVVTQTANTFTIAPSATELDNGSFIVRFTASDGTYSAYRDSVFTLPSTPPAVANVQSTYTLSTLGNATVITLGATDAETSALAYSYTVVAGSTGNIANVTQSNNTFTITPSVGETYAGTFTLRFGVSDGVNTTYTNNAVFTKPSTPPTIANVASTYTLSTLGNATVISLSASDPEGTPLTYSYQVVSGALGNIASVSSTANVFTISPSLGETYAGSFTLRFGVSDGTNTTYTNNATFTKPSTAPTITSSLNASYTLATNGTATVINVTATDAENTPLTYGYQVISGSLGSTATVTQSGGQFTITPSTNSANGGTFQLRFSVTDGVNTVYTNGATFSLNFDSTPPTITSSLNSSYTLATNGTATTITITATDPATPITYGYEVTSGSLGSTASISQTNNVFTITPSTNSANAGSFALRFFARDSFNNTAYTNSATFTLDFVTIIGVGQGSNNIAYSTDGINWTGVTGKSIFSSIGFGVAWSGTRWVAVGDGTNSIAYSNNGISWTGLGKSVFDYALQVAWSGTRFVAVGSGTNSIAYSSDGINWTGVTGKNIFSGYGQGVAWNGTRFVAVGSNNAIAYSSDGINWTVASQSVLAYGYGVTWGGGRWVAVGYGSTHNIAYSSDGISWTGTSGKTIFSEGGYAVASNGSRFVAGGYDTNTLAYSNDGISWTGLGKTIFTGSSGSGVGRAVAWIGTRWLAGGYSTNGLAYSSDGINWTGLGTSIFDTCFGIAAKT